MNIVRKVGQLIGLDGPVVFNLLAKLVSIFSGLVNIFMIAHFLTDQEQGFYYTFSSILGLQIFVELGLSYVILQFVSHEKAHLEINGDGIILGKDEAKDRLASLFNFQLRWYSWVSLLVFVFVTLGGVLFFEFSEGYDKEVSWKWPWILFMLSASLLIFLYSLYAFLEGFGFIAKVAKTRFYQLFISNLFFWIFLLLGFDLYSLAILKTVEFIVGAGIVYKSYRHFFNALIKHYKDDLTHKIEWKKEVLPLQWKIALSWLSGYLIFQLFTPVLFAFQGAVVSGQMGMTLNIMSSIISLPMIWINTKVPIWGGYIVNRQYDLLDNSFRKTFFASYSVLIFMSLCVCIGYYFLEYAYPLLRLRLVGPQAFVMLLLINLINLPVFAEASYLRAHKQEPFLITSLVNGVLIAISTFVAAKWFHITEVVVGYFIVTLFFGLIWGTKIFFQKKKEWHAVV